jgi:SNF2 family DNA or RNA helicase
VPSADDIYGIVFEGRMIRGLPPITPENQRQGLVFSRYPASLELHLTFSGMRDATNLIWSVIATADNHEISVTDVIHRKADHVIIDSCWHPFVQGELEEVRRLLSSAGISSVNRLTLRQYLELRKIGVKTPLVKDLTQGAAGAQNVHAIAGSEPPKGIVGTLYPYQIDGWQWLSLIHREGLGGILADEMGLGKTLQIIAMLSAAGKASSKSPSLVVATGTLLENWRRELEKFAPNILTLVHHGAERTGFPSALRTVDLVITSYDTVTRDIALLRQIDWNMVILDEAQAIKNPETRRATVIKRLPRRIGVAVTGTPVENRLMDLWSIVDFVLPGFLGTREWFDRTYANDPGGAAALEPLVSPILLRRKIRDVAQDLPLRIDIPQALELNPGAANEYDQLRRDILADYGEAAGLVALVKLRMYCAHPFLIGAHEGDPAEVSDKYARLLEILEEIIDSREKVLIFTSFQEMADILTSDLAHRYSIPCTFIDGRVAIPDRQTVVDHFSSHAGPAVLVLNPRAAGTGLNITAANHVVHYNLEWNPAVEDQASARAYRRGQQLPVTMHRLYYANTVEEVIDDRLTRKRALAETAVVGTKGVSDDYADILRVLKTSPVGTK